MISVSKFQLIELKIASYDPYGKQNFCGNYAKIHSMPQKWIAVNVCACACIIMCVLQFNQIATETQTLLCTICAECLIS